MKIITLNIRHGGGSRINLILLYLNKFIDWDIIVLTEFRLNKNSNVLFKFFEENQFNVAFHKIDSRSNSVLVASKIKAEVNTTEELKEHEHRIIYQTFDQFRLMGCYFPQKNEKAKVFDYIIDQIKNSSLGLITIGDFNTGKHLIDEKGSSFYCSEYLHSLEQNRMVDAYRKVHGNVTEYSWYSNSGNGFRIDHIFISESLEYAIEECGYDHHPRELKISDHSAMFLQLKL